MPIITFIVGIFIGCLLGAAITIGYVLMSK